MTVFVFSLIVLLSYNLLNKYRFKYIRVLLYMRGNTNFNIRNNSCIRGEHFPSLDIRELP